MSPDSDLLVIDARDVRYLDEEELIRLFALARDRGDRARAREAWKVLAAHNYDRVRGMVAAFRFPGHAHVRVAPRDYADAAHECLIRALAMFANFRGSSLGQFRAALRTCVKNTCMDFCRRTLQVERGLAGSLEDELPGDDEPRSRFERDLARIAERHYGDETSAREAADLLARALPRIENPNMRTVLELTRDGHSSREIADRLDLTVANVDQLRSRGLKKLRGVLSDDQQ